MASDAQRAARRRYDSHNIVKRTIAFGPADAELLGWLDAQPNKAGYIKDLIRADMGRSQQTTS